MLEDGLMRVIVVGGGIGGMSSALALANIGCEVCVLEKNAEFGEIGAGIQIGPNGFQALDRLGVGNEVKRKSVRIDSLNLLDSTTGNVITSLSLDDDFRRRFGNPYRVIHRSELHGSLLRECRSRKNIVLISNCKVVSYYNSEKGVDVLTQEGERYAADVLVGSDGLSSRIRMQMTGNDELRISGHVSYRAVVPKEIVPRFAQSNSVNLWAGPKCHIVHYPVMSGSHINLVATIQSDNLERFKPGSYGDKNELIKYFRSSIPRLRELLEIPDEWKKWALADREPIESWTDGRVVLLGDAAHPTLQYLAQGACMALEDSVSLASAFDQGHGNIVEAFKVYERERMPRAYRVVLQSRLFGEIYHAQGAYRAVRDSLFIGKTAEDQHNALRWLYSAKVA